MKKIIMIVTISAVSLFFTNTTFGQLQKKHFSFSNSDSLQLLAGSSLVAVNEKTHPVSEPVKEAENINSRAIKLFSRDFKNAEEVKWYKMKDGYVSYCNIDGNKNKVFYDQKGRLVGSTISYTDKTLPKEIRAIVKSVYYDYTITHADATCIGGRIYYKVNVKDEKSWKIIDISDNEIVQVIEFQE